MPLLEEEGRFYATVKAAELGEAQTGTPFIQLNFETDEGSISGRLWLSENAFTRSFEVLKECFDFDGNFESLKPIVGKECSITTELEEYETDKGETKSTLKVKWINPKGGPKMDPKAQKSLAAKLSAQAGFKPAAGNNEEDPF